MIARKARFRHHKTFERLCGYHLPSSAFHGAVVEAINSKINFEQLKPEVRNQILFFIRDFSRCNCRDAPLCGCPERKFARKILELRENGLDHRGIADNLSHDYGLALFPADILSYLEDAVHVLLAVLDIARLSDQKNLVLKTEEHIKLTER